MSARVVAFRSPNRFLRRICEGRAALFQDRQRAVEDLERRRGELVELGHQVADELSGLSRAELRELGVRRGYLSPGGTSGSDGPEAA